VRKKSEATVDDATLESRRSLSRIVIARRPRQTNQSCDADSPKSFFRNLLGERPAIAGSGGFPWSNATTSSPARHSRFGGIGIPIRVMGVQLGASLAGKLSCESLSILSDSGTTRDR
jgi:hypothetical protein